MEWKEPDGFWTLLSRAPGIAWRAMPTQSGIKVVRPTGEQTVEVTILAETPDGFIFEVANGVPVGLGIKYYVERVGMGEVEVKIVESATYRVENNKAIYSYRATYL